MSDDQQVMSAVYQSELKLKSHLHKLDGDERAELESIVTDLQELRKDLQPDTHFGELE